MTVLVADIGGTKIAAGVVDQDSGVLSHVRTMATPADGGRVVLEAVISLLTDMVDGDVMAVGIASAGVIDPADGSVVEATSSIPAWAGTPIGSRVRSALGLPTHVLGDGQAFALGEAAHGPASDARCVVVLAVGTGVGGGYVDSTAIMRGRRGVAGHFGHVAVPQAVGLDCYCGKAGHLEAIGSGPGILRRYHERGGEAQVADTRELFARVESDPRARDAIRLGGEAVGTAAGSLANAFDPDAVVVTGGVAQRVDVWEGPLRSAFSEMLLPSLESLPLWISRPEEWSSLRGVAHYACQREAARG